MRFAHLTGILSPFSLGNRNICITMYCKLNTLYYICQKKSYGTNNNEF